MPDVYRMDEVKGLTPAVDPTRSNAIFALNGKNYIFDAIGPKSPFGDRFLLPQPLEDVIHIQAIRLKIRGEDRCFTITNQAIMEWIEGVGGWRIIYVIPDTTSSPYRWTWGYVSEALFFCHPRTGIIFYSPDNDIAGPLTGQGVPTDAIAICVNNGMLVAMTPEYVMWSDPSGPTNFTPNLGGAGFQLIAARISGYPIMITTYAQGVLTWTTGGVLRSEYTGDQEVYRHRPLNIEYRPINSFCTFKSDDDTVVILDERGLFQSKGMAPTPFAPLFNEFLIGWLQDNDLRLGQNVRLEWDELKRLLYLSYSFSRYDALYEGAFVLYPPTDKWGQFSESHYGILPVKINGGERDDDYFGYVDANRRLRSWRSTGSREVPGVHFTDDLYYPVIQKPFHDNDGDSGIVLSSSMRFSTRNDILITQRAGYYPNDGFTPVPAVLGGLDSWLQIGLLRNTEDRSYDEMSEVSSILVRSSQSGPTSRTSGEYSLAPPNPQGFDYTLDESASYALEEINYVNHGLIVVGTNDGVSQYMAGMPALAGFSRGARHYSCSVSGIWHTIELTATEVGEAFHLKTLELTSISAGRLM